jgi:uncharacterized protein
MAEYSDKIEELEAELKKTKYNKATQHHIGLIKAKIAKLKEKKEQSKKGGKKGEGFSVRKSGDATVVLIGFPSVGKSTLLNQITNAESRVGAYDFTTLTVIPGLLEYEGAKIQVLDVPGVIKGASEGKGRGKEIFSVLRAADLLAVVIDVKHPGQLKIIKDEMYDIGLRLNKTRPDITIKRTIKGGINLVTSVKLKKLMPETIKAMLNEFKIVNADVIIREDVNEDELIDVIEDNKVYVPAITVLNKIDLVKNDKLEQVKRAVKPDICISADKGFRMDELKELIFAKLGLIRIYCKQPGKKPDMDEALIVKKGAELNDVCKKLHRGFENRFRFARIWGSAKYGGMRIQRLDFPLKDKDIVELHLR